MLLSQNAHYNNAKTTAVLALPWAVLVVLVVVLVSVLVPVPAAV